MLTLTKSFNIVVINMLMNLQESMGIKGEKIGNFQKWYVSCKKKQMGVLEVKNKIFKKFIS